jgi:FkbM family methyltransferase
MWLVFPETRTIEAPSLSLMMLQWGKVWDVGCNFGFYAMVAARANNQVFAFDMSPRALAMLARSCKLNHLAVTPVERPLTTTRQNYATPLTSDCTNRCVDGSGDSKSMTYLEAEALYGAPAFIKMDIEGGEREFLESHPFQEWIQANRITLLVEVHHGYHLARDAFPAMTRRQLDEYHILLEPKNAVASPAAHAGASRSND